MIEFMFVIDRSCIRVQTQTQLVLYYQMSIFFYHVWLNCFYLHLTLQIFNEISKFFCFNSWIHHSNFSLMNFAIIVNLQSINLFGDSYGPSSSLYTVAFGPNWINLQLYEGSMEACFVQEHAWRVRHLTSLV